MKRALRFFLLVVLMIFISVQFVSAQSSFPAGSTSGTTTMNSEVTPVTVPLVDLQLRQPENGKDFSVTIIQLHSNQPVARVNMRQGLASYIPIEILLALTLRVTAFGQVPKKHQKTTSQMLLFCEHRFTRLPNIFQKMKQLKSGLPSPILS